MAEQAQPRSETAASKLRQFPVHTTYYNSFFVLRTEVILNGQPAEIGCSDDCELTLCCRYFPLPGTYSTAKPSVSFPSISAKVEEILKNHGVCEFKGFFCEDSPLYQVTFSSEYGLKNFLRKTKRVEKEMAALISDKLQPPQQAGAAATLVPTRVNATLFLMTPDAATKNCAQPREVTLENHSSCMAVWKESEVFDFGDVFRVYRIDPVKLQDQGEVSLASVLHELEKVFEWFVLGPYLGVPEHELETIKLDHLNNNKECKQKMVSTWMKRGDASWSALVRALWAIGRCALAKKIAYKFGSTLPPAALKTSDQKLPTTDQPSQKPRQSDTVQTKLLSSIEHHDHRLEEQTASVEKVTETKTTATEKYSSINRSLSQALSSIDQLSKAREIQEKQLTAKKRNLCALEAIGQGQSNLEESVELLKQEIRDLQCQLAQKDKEIADVTAEANGLRGQLQEATAELVIASSELSKLKTEREALRGDLERERRELEKVQYRSVFKHEQISELKGEVTTLRAEANSKAEETGVLKGRLLSQSEEVERLRKALHEAEQRKPALPEQPSAAAAAAATVQQQLLHTMETSELRVKLATAEEGRQEVERQLGALQRQVQLLEEEMKQGSQKEGKLYSAKCTGPGLKAATVNEVTRFSVYLVTEGGEKCEDPNAVVTGELVSEDGRVVKCQVSKKEENRYELRYQPQHNGRFQLHIKVNGSHSKDSPFQVQVVERLQLAQGTHVKTIGGLNYPRQLAVSDSGEIVVAEYSSNCVSVFDREGRKLHSFGNQGSADMKLVHPRGVALLSDNTVLVAAEHCVKKFRMDGTFIASVGSSGSVKLQFDRPCAVAADERGKKIYVCDTFNHRIQVLNFDLSYHSSFGSKGTGRQQFNSPKGIAIDSHQNVFVTDFYNQRVLVFNSEGRFQHQIKQCGAGMEELDYPVSVCIDQDDNVYVLEFNKCRVCIFSNKGDFIKSFGRKGNKAGEFDRPYGIAVDNSGCIYISEDGSNRIHIFS